MPREMSRPFPTWLRDCLLLAARLLVATVMLAHVWQNLAVTGFSSTTQTFSHFGIPIAIVATAFTMVVELIGSVLLAAGLLVPLAAAGFTFVMGGAIYFVHAPHGIFVKDGGWELVGMIIAVVLAVAAAGPGRFSVSHLLDERRRRAEALLPPHLITDPDVYAATQQAVRTPAQRPATEAAATTPARRNPFEQTAFGQSQERRSGLEQASHGRSPITEEIAVQRAAAQGHADQAEAWGDDAPVWTEPVDQDLFTRR